MHKLLVICVPTATGKTSLAIHLAKKFSPKGRPASGWNGELISADSRQVYKGMDIGTGKELPVNSKLKIKNLKLGKKRIGFYEIRGIRVWGYDLVDPKEEFSVAQYVKFADKIIKNIGKRGKLPILVGGTGLYIKAVVDGIPTAVIPKSISLRKKYKNKSVRELQDILGKLDSFKLSSMNVSDRKNPRRLVRAIEIAKWMLEVGSKKLEKSRKYEGDSVLFIGLTASREFLENRIDKRVEERIRSDVEDEIKNLLKFGIKWNSQAMQSLGYKQWFRYFNKEKTLKEIVDDWLRAEKNYAKRQMTWFKKDERINWFDITKPNWEEDVEDLVKKWYI